MIIEGLITTSNAEGVINVAPMGPIVEGEFQAMLLRPWKGSTTYRNLCCCDEAVFHVVDEVDLIAEAAIRKLTHVPPMFAAQVVKGQVLQDCCQWFELQVTDRDLSHDRAEIRATVVHCGQQKPFSGFNRAKHAILEAAILATRIDLLDPSDVRQQFSNFRSAVEKTGTERHRQLFQMLADFVAERSSRKVSCDAG